MAAEIGAAGNINAFLMGQRAEVEDEVVETLVEEIAVVAGISPAVDINPREMR
jgi:hypothetical protein